MMSLDAPAPRAVRLWLAENRNVIKLRITRRAAALLQVLEHVVEAHDRDCLRVTPLAQGAVQQRVRKQSLAGGEFLEWQAVPGARDETEIETLGVFQFETGLGLLIRSERGEKTI